jgi:hypothetical protein
VHHEPWPLQKCEMQIEENSMCNSIGLNLDEPPCILQNILTQSFGNHVMWNDNNGHLE